MWFLSYVQPLSRCKSPPASYCLGRKHFLATPLVAQTGCMTSLSHSYVNLLVQTVVLAAAWAPIHSGGYRYLWCNYSPGSWGIHTSCDITVHGGRPHWVHHSEWKGERVRVCKWGMGGGGEEGEGEGGRGGRGKRGKGCEGLLSEVHRW